MAKMETKVETIICKVLHRKQRKIENESLLKWGLNSGSPEGWAVPVPNVTPVMLIL